MKIQVKNILRLGHNWKIRRLLINPGWKYPQFEVILLRLWDYDPACTVPSVKEKLCINSVDFGFVEPTFRCCGE